MVRKVGGAENWNFSTDAANFRPREFSVLQISISTLTFPKMGFSSTNFAFLDESFFDEKIFRSDNFSTAKNLGGGGGHLPPPTSPLPRCHFVGAV